MLRDTLSEVSSPLRMFLLVFEEVVESVIVDLRRKSVDGVHYGQADG